MGVCVQVLLTLQCMSHIIEKAGCNDFQALQMQQNITTFEDILGGCERLLRTPIPVSYTRHTSRFLLLWLTLLPFSLYGKLEWATIPAVGFIALLLLGALVPTAPCSSALCEIKHFACALPHNFLVEVCNAAVWAGHVVRLLANSWLASKVQAHF